MRAVILVLCCFVLSAEAGRLDLSKFEGAAEPKTRTYTFDHVEKVEQILQRNGTNRFVLANSPGVSWWEWSEDGEHWKVLSETKRENDGRIWRLHRLKKPVAAKFLRVRFEGGMAAGEAIFDSPARRDELDRWVLIVNSTDSRKLPGHGQEFMPLVRSVAGWERTQGQQVWVGDVTRELVEAEPRPVAVFFSGSFKDWCEVERHDWAGVENVLKKKSAPIWASCGGAQALAIVAENGTAKAWDCPHCRDPRAPKLPIYTHIGHTVEGKACGDYSGCIFEKGAHNMRVLKHDPVFEGLGEEFKAMESHCGQIEWAPRGWELIATAGEGTLTRVQCIKRRHAPIYAAQFHIEMAGTQESSRRIMGNFLEEAEQWQAGRIR